MTPNERALLAYHQQRRDRKQATTEADLDEYEASIEAIKREMAPVQACIDLKRKR